MQYNHSQLPKVIGLIILTTLALTACSTALAAPEDAAANAAAAAAPASAESAAEEVTAANESGLEAEEAGADATVPSPVYANGLTDVEVDGLLFMREEEKLAHDVYLTLYEAWGLPLFQNIAGSEQSHTEAVLHLLDTYGIDDPAEGNILGVFVNPDLQTLYDDLTAWGSQSLADALKVGAAIEEIDILDLQDNLATPSNAAIEQVYQKLLSGSENHLRAFTQTLARQTGETYTPQYMSQEAYDAIIGGSAQMGIGSSQGGRGGGRKP